MTTSKKENSNRFLAVRLKDPKKYSPSSQHWLRRQLNDPYVIKAQQEGYRSRSAYKLLEIDEKFKIFRKGQSVVDLGAAPGGWLQVVAQKIQLSPSQGKLIAVDLLPFAPIEGADCLTMDFLDPEAPGKIISLLEGGKADVVISDMAANAIGHKKTDHLRTLYLAEIAADLAQQILAPGGCFLAKVLQGGTEASLLSSLKSTFRSVKHIKPKASRAESSELYVLATGFRGA